MNHESIQGQTELIQSSIHLIQKLRAGVGQVFKDLSDGISEHEEDTSSSKETSSDSSKEASSSLKDKSSVTSQTKDGAGNEKSEDQQEKHRAILRTLKKSLETISHDFSDLEKKGAAVTPVHHLSNVDYLSLDPVDKNSVMHPQLLQSYKWTNKMHELANHAFTLLSQNQLKRTQTPSYTSAKKPKTTMPLIVQPAVVDRIIQDLDQYVGPEVPITISRPLGAPGVIQIELKRTLRAVIVLRGLMIDGSRSKVLMKRLKQRMARLTFGHHRDIKCFRRSPIMLKLHPYIFMLLTTQNWPLSHLCTGCKASPLCSRLPASSVASIYRTTCPPPGGTSGAKRPTTTCVGCKGHNHRRYCIKTWPRLCVSLFRNAKYNNQI